MSDADLITLYSDRILRLAADIPHVKRLSAPMGRVRRRAPLCGSTITVDIVMQNGKIAEFGQDVKACALGQAAASVVGSVVHGRTRAEVEKARDEMLLMLKSDGPAPQAPFEGLEVLVPARAYKNRHASIMLALEATLEAIDAALDTGADAVVDQKSPES